jgi:hypothetical protein
VRGLRSHHGQLELGGGPDLHPDQAEGRGHLSRATDTEHRANAERPALKDAPDKAVRLQHTDQRVAMDCVALVDRIDALARPA